MSYQGSFHYGKEFDNVRKEKRQQGTHPADRREPEKRPDLSISVHRHSRQTADSVFLRSERTAGKEKEIQKQLDDGIDYAAGKINVIQLLERYISIKQGVRYNTKVGYNFVLNLVKKGKLIWFAVYCFVVGIIILFVH